MATGLKSRIIYREHSDSNTTLAGTYKLLVRANSIPSPLQDPNIVEKTSLEDAVQVYDMGIIQSGLMNVEGEYLRKYVDEIAAVNGKKLDIIHLYGTDGVGGLGKYAYQGQVMARPVDIGGNDEIIKMSVAIVPNTVPVDIFDDFTVTTTGADDTLSFTLAAKV